MRTERCPYCRGSGEAWDPQTGEGPLCPACGGSGRRRKDSKLAAAFPHAVDCDLDEDCSCEGEPALRTRPPSN